MIFSMVFSHCPGSDQYVCKCTGLYVFSSYYHSLLCTWWQGLSEIGRVCLTGGNEGYHSITHRGPATNKCQRGRKKETKEQHARCHVT